MKTVVKIIFARAKPIKKIIKPLTNINKTEPSIGFPRVLSMLRATIATMSCIKSMPMIILPCKVSRVFLSDKSLTSTRVLENIRIKPIYIQVRLSYFKILKAA